MNLLFVNTKKNWGGIVNLCATLMKGLAAQGHNSVWVVSSQRFTKFQMPVPITNVSLNFGFDFNPIAIIKLIRIIRSQHIDAVVVNIAKEIIFGGIAARLCGIKCIRMVGNEFDFKQHRFLNNFLVDINIHPSQWTLSQAETSYPYVNTMRNEVLHFGSEERKVTGQEMAAEYQRLGLSSGDFIIGCTGRIVADKGVQTLVQAFALIANKLPQARLVINGTGSLLPEIKELAAQLGIANRVCLFGFAPDCLIAASIYDLAIMPSRLEGFPNTLIEYLSLGKAVITTPVGGIPEAIQDGVNGMFFPVDDAQTLAEKILSLASDPVRVNSLGTQAQKSFQERFTTDKMCSGFLSIIGTQR